MTTETAAVSYAIDPIMSRFTIRVFASGLLSGFGHTPTIAVRGYQGIATFAPDDLQNATLKVSIQADSMTDADDVSQKDRQDIESRMKEDVLETDRFPEITFESSQISAEKQGEGSFRVTIVGDLSLHGVCRKESIQAQAVLNGPTLRGFGEFTIRQSDYDIELVSVAGGALKVKDEIKVSFDMLARKQG